MLVTGFTHLNGYLLLTTQMHTGKAVQLFKEERQTFFTITIFLYLETLSYDKSSVGHDMM